MRYAGRLLVSWAVAIIVVGLAYNVVNTEGDLLAAMRLTFAALAGFGPTYLLLTALPFSASVLASWYLAKSSRFVLAVGSMAAYLVVWTLFIAVLTWLPPFGRPDARVDLAVAFWFGPVVAVILGLLLPRPSRQL